MDTRNRAIELVQMGLRIQMVQEITGVSRSFLSDVWREQGAGNPGRLRGMSMLFSSRPFFHQVTAFMYCLVKCERVKNAEFSRGQTFVDAFRAFSEIRGVWAGRGRDQLTVNDAGLLFLAYRRKGLVRMECSACGAPAWVIPENVRSINCAVCKGGRGELICDGELAMEPTRERNVA
jgi:hypothetical protein